VSVATSSQLEEVLGKTVAERFAEARSEQDSLWKQFDETFDRLEQWQSELWKREQHVDRERSSLDERTAEIEQMRQAAQTAAEHQENQLHKLQEQIEQLNQQVAAKTAAASELEKRVAEVSEERDRLLEVGQVCVEREGEWVAASEQLSAVKRALAESQEELAAAKNMLQQREMELEQIQGRNKNNDEQLIVEQELQNVRARAAALTQDLEQQRRELSVRQSSWAHELKKLRRQLEEERAAAKSRETSAVAAETTCEDRSASTPSHDPDDLVVGSVLAQFERIRNQKANRRGRPQQGAKK